MNQSKRLISLDAFRGLTIIMMIFVNNPGSWKYLLPPFSHASWHGCRIADLVFPFFLFIMGTAMAYSFRKHIESNEPSFHIHLKILKRTIILFLLGFTLSLIPYFHFQNARLMGVLQRIAICYLFTSLIVLHSKEKIQYVIGILMLLIYWGLMYFQPLMNSVGNPWDFGNTFAQYIDKLILKEHMWKNDIEPEGLISTIPAIVNTLIGYWTGLFLMKKIDGKDKIISLFVVGNILLAAGLIWSFAMPINKQLWTGSYVFVTCGSAINFLAVFYWFVDIKGFSKMTSPFIIFGSNAILAFFGSSLMARIFYFIKIPVDGESLSLKNYIFLNILSPVMGNYAAGVFYPIVYLILWFFILKFFYNKKIFLKV